MAQERIRRRLVAILAADVVGYSRLMREDEAGTLAQLKRIKMELLDPKAAEYGGRIFKSMGDGLLIEFPSAVDAVQYADEVQHAMAEGSASVPKNQRMELRIGINVGDVIVEADDLYGDGVNVAARLEGLAPSGGVCVSGTVFDQVKDKLNVGFDDLGPQEVKNIPEKVRTYQMRCGPLGDSTINRRHDVPPALPTKPSIAVLPFVNMSGNSEQEYFADGITEDLITALSRIRWFFVIARNSCFAYKGLSPDIREVARALGVAYVLDGSIRKAGNRIRVTAQLIDGGSGNHVWAERYDRDLRDIFAVQDEITTTLVGAIEPELGRADRERARAKRPGDLRAWDLCQRGFWHTYRRTEADLAKAQLSFRQAIEVDSGLARAYAGAEEACFFQIIGGYVDTEGAKADALRFAARAVELDGQDAFNRYALGRALTMVRRHDAAIFELRKATELDPSFAQAHYALGMALSTSGHPDEALPQIDMAMRLSPQDAYFGQFLLRKAEACLFLGRLEDAVEWAERSLREPNIQWSRWAILAAAQAHLGRTEAAQRSVDGLRGLRPDIDLAFARDYWPIADVGALDCLVEGLRKAGLPG